MLRERRPPSNLYVLNRDHVSADGITALVSMWTTLLERMRAQLDTWSTPAVAAWLFGSAARGQATSEQQTDLFVARVRAWSGNACELLEMELSELEDAAARDERLVHDLRDQAVVLAGQHPGQYCRARGGRDRASHARVHLSKAQEFMQAAEMNLDLELFNAATSDAVISGINPGTRSAWLCLAAPAKVTTTSRRCLSCGAPDPPASSSRPRCRVY